MHFLFQCFSVHCKEVSEERGKPELKMHAKYTCKNTLIKITNGLELNWTFLGERDKRHEPFRPRGNGFLVQCFGAFWYQSIIRLSIILWGAQHKLPKVIWDIHIRAVVGTMWAQMLAGTQVPLSGMSKRGGGGCIATVTRGLCDAY